MNWKHAAVAAGTLLGMIASGSVLASDRQKMVEARWRGAWVLTGVDTYSDCAGTHTNNRVNGSLVSSRGRYRFRPGELARVDKIDLKRSRLDLILSLPEPVLFSHQDGPFTLYDESRCLLELEVELSRSAGAGDDADGIDAALKPVLKRYTSEEEATQAKAWNHRKRDAYPADYDRTLAEHTAWKAQQANAAIQARIDKAMEETSRIADRIAGNPDYLKGFAAGVEAMHAVDLTQCPALMSRDFSNLAAGSNTVAVAGFGGDAAGLYNRGFQDGQRLVFGLESMRRLPQFMVPVPQPAGTNGPPQGN